MANPCNADTYRRATAALARGEALLKEIPVTTRYDQLLALIDKHKPTTIIEVGVHRAVRAVAMTSQALRHHQAVDYIGFDVFETLGPKFQEAALNGKGMPTEAHARHQLKRAQNVAKAKGKTLDVCLVVGDTRKTLHGQMGRPDAVMLPPWRPGGTLAFIDGDHRIDAIRGDYEGLMCCSVVVFDDFYVPDADGATVDLSKYGANAVVVELQQAGHTVEILPAADPCKHGGRIHLAVVTR